MLQLGVSQADRDMLRFAQNMQSMYQAAQSAQASMAQEIAATRALVNVQRERMAVTAQVTAADQAKTAALMQETVVTQQLTAATAQATLVLGAMGNTLQPLGEIVKRAYVGFANLA